LFAATAQASDAIDVGTRLEPIVDDALIEKLDGASLRLHPPTPREVVIRFDRPWEGRFSGTVAVVKDAGKYLAYYRGLPKSSKEGGETVICCATSDDGVHWTKPNLGLVEIQGTKENNVIIAKSRESGGFAPFIDTRPGTPADQRFKALGGISSFDAPEGECGLYAFASPDGIHWRLLSDERVITREKGEKRHAFDSPNVSFWSERDGCYVCYFRLWVENMRWIGRTTSQDFINWTPYQAMTGDGRPLQHLYTNQFVPYLRAPHIFIGFPTRFMKNRRVLGLDQMEAMGTPKNYLKDCTDILLISTRGGNVLTRTFLEAFIRPGLDPHNWTSRANYAARGIFQTSPEELSIYVKHNTGYPTSYLRRYTLRPDGFASVYAPFAGGEMTTKPLRFSGDRLTINFSTSAAGSVRVELQDAAGRPLPGFALDDCPEIIGDRIERTVAWKNGSDLGALSGKPIRLRFVLKDADVFAFRFLRD